MPGLIGDILRNSQALQTHQAGVQTAGRNVANVNDPHYSRQRIEQSHSPTTGVQVDNVRQMRDAVLDRQLLTELFANADLATRGEVLSRLEALFGETLDRSDQADTVGGDAALEGLDSGGLANHLNGLFVAFQQVANNPEDPAAREVLLARAEALVNDLNRAEGDLAQLEEDILDAATADAGRVDALAAEIADLNAQIARLEARDPRSGQSLTLRDERQRALEELAQLTSYTQSANADNEGMIDISIDGQPLVTGSAVANTFTIDTSTGTPVYAVGGANVTLTGGALAGYAPALNDVALLRGELDALALQLTTSVNNAYNPAQTDPALDFFVDPRSSGGAAPTAGTLSLNANLVSNGDRFPANLRTGTSGSDADNDLMKAAAALADQTFSTNATPPDAIDGSFLGFLSGAHARVGRAVQDNSAAVAQQELLTRMAQAQRDSFSGVSLDEEAGDLVRYQRAYQATARVLNTVDELLELVVTRLGN